jgi:hypothetical protein
LGFCRLAAKTLYPLFFLDAKKVPIVTQKRTRSNRKNRKNIFSGEKFRDDPETEERFNSANF